MQARKLVGRLVGVVVGSILVTSATGLGVGAVGAVAPELVTTPHPVLHLNRLIQTSPFLGSAIKVYDNEGSTYVPGDDTLWMADDQSDALFEVDRTTGHLHRRIPQADFLNALQVGVGTPAGQTRNEDLEALAYDADADVLYAFSGSTGSAAGPSLPTVYRLTRDVNNEFQVDSWRAVPTEWTGAGWRQADGLTYVAENSTIRTYDYNTDTFGTPFVIPTLSNILGIDFDDVTGDLIAVNSQERLYRASMTTRALRAGWSGIDLHPFGLLDTRGVEVIGEQVFVTDGADSVLRPEPDPRAHAVFVLDVTTDTAGPVIQILTPPNGAVYPQNQIVPASFWCADELGGSGLASCAGTVANNQAIDTATVGQRTFTVIGADVAGNTSRVDNTYTVATGRPDARIRRGANPAIGNDIYNTDGAGETLTGNAPGRQAVTYHVTVQNDAPFAERLRVRGGSSTPRFAVRYRDANDVNVTDQVTAGTFVTPVLAPQGIYRMTVVVTVRSSAVSGNVLSRKLTAISTTHPAIRDAVRFDTSRA